MHRAGQDLSSSSFGGRDSGYSRIIAHKMIRVLHISPIQASCAQHDILVRNLSRHLKLTILLWSLSIGGISLVEVSRVMFVAGNVPEKLAVGVENSISRAAIRVIVPW